MNVNHTPSTSSLLDFVVNASATSTLLISNANPAFFGANVTFSATVSATAPGAGTPSGSVVFKEGATTLGTVALSGGSATLTLSNLSVATHTISASYLGDGNFSASNSNSVGEVIAKSNTLALVTSSVNPSLVGQQTTLTASVVAVSPGTGLPTGTVTFLDGATTLGSGTLNNGLATLGVSSLSPGTHSITAVYAGNSNYATSTSAALSQSVNSGSTTTTLASSANPSVIGQGVALTATVTLGAPATGIPLGSVTFMDGTNSLGTTTLDPNGQAVFVTPFNVLGSHPLTAVYGGGYQVGPLDGQNGWNGGIGGFVNTNPGDADVVSGTAFSGSKSWKFVNGYNTPGQGSPFSPQVASVGALSQGAQGNQSVIRLSFMPVASGDNSRITVYEGSVNRDDRTGANLYVQNLPNGTVDLYMYRSDNDGPTNDFAFQVPPFANVPANVWTTVEMSTDYPTPNPADRTTWGTTTYKVNGVPVYSETTWTHWWRFQHGFAYAPGGSIKFTNNDAGAGFYIDDVSMTVNNTVTSQTIASFSTSFEGSNFATSTSAVLSQSVNQAATTTTISSNVNPSVLGNAVTFTARVSSNAPGSGTPTGSVTFKDNGVALPGTQPVALAAGVASFTTTTNLYHWVCTRLRPSLAAIRTTRRAPR